MQTLYSLFINTSPWKQKKNGFLSMSNKKIINLFFFLLWWTDAVFWHFSPSVTFVSVILFELGQKTFVFQYKLLGKLMGHICSHKCTLSGRHLALVYLWVMMELFDKVISHNVKPTYNILQVPCKPLRHPWTWASTCMCNTCQILNQIEIWESWPEGS